VPTNIDEEFAEAMRYIGGKRPVEINPDVSNTLNADIILPDDGVILEVKTLMSDPSHQSGHIEKVSAIYHKWAGLPGVPIAFGEVTIDTSGVPEKMAFELLRTLSGPIRAGVTKSNKQIRELKKSLGMPKAHGVLVMCNAGATTLTPHFVMHALHHALGKRHSSINSLIYLTYGVPVKMPRLPEPVEFFATLTREGGEPLPPGLGRRIQDAWMRHQSRNGGLVKVYQKQDIEMIYEGKNVKPAAGRA